MERNYTMNSSSAGSTSPVAMMAKVYLLSVTLSKEKSKMKNNVYEYYQEPLNVLSFMLGYF